MAKTRKSGRGVLGFLFRPVSDLLQGTKGVIRKGTNTARNIVSRSINGVNAIGRTTVSSVDSAISDVIPKGLKKRISMRSKKNSRRNSRSSKKSRKNSKNSRRN